MAYHAKYKVRESSSNIETHEVFLDTLAHQRESELGISEKRFEVQIKERIIYDIFGVFFLLALVYFGKVFYLQIVQGHALYIASEDNKGKISLISPERGIIYDTHFTKLVSNAPAYDFVCDKRNLSLSSPASVKEIKTMAGLLHMSEQDIDAEITSSEDVTVLVAQNLPQETLLAIEARLGDMPDCHTEKNVIRNYAMGSMFSQVLGYMGKVTKSELQQNENYTASDSIGKTGLEKSY